MDSKKIEELKKAFEGAAQEHEAVAFWMARDLQKLLGYANWQNFEKVVAKARIACEKAGEELSAHFIEVDKMVKLGQGTERAVADIMLTRYACYLVAQNGDPRKDAIAFAQSYFAIQTRKQELLEERIKLNERIRARKKLTAEEKELSKLIYEKGVDQQGFARIRSKGDQALFGGFSTGQMKLRMAIPKNRPLADFLPEITITAKTLATQLTNFNTRQHGLHGEEDITHEHVTNNRSIRDMLIERGVKPEDLPPEEDIKKLERKIKRADEELLQKKNKKRKKE